MGEYFLIGVLVVGIGVDLRDETLHRLWPANEGEETLPQCPVLLFFHLILVLKRLLSINFRGQNKHFPIVFVVISRRILPCHYRPTPRW